MFLIILGFAMLYSVGHFFIIQHSTEYKNRTTYEKVVTWFAIVSIILTFIGIMAE